MNTNKRLSKMITQWSTNLLYDDEKHSSDSSHNIFDTSEQGQSDSADEIPIPDIDAEIRADLCLFGGVYCDKLTDNEYVFMFPPIIESTKPKVFALQILKTDGKYKVNTYAMPVSVDMDELIATVKLDNEAHVISFVKECKHHVTCYYIREEQYEKLQKIVSEIKNCIVHTNFGYSEICLKLFGVEDKKNNISMDVSINLKYLSTEVRPHKIQLDWESHSQLPENLRKRLKVFTHAFKERDLSNAIEALISTDDTEFSWKRTYESGTPHITEITSSEEENSLSNFISKQLKSIKMQTKKKKLKKSAKKKQTTSHNPLLEESDNGSISGNEEKNVKSMKKGTLTSNDGQKLSMDTKTGKTIKGMKQKKISSMLQVKAQECKPVALENNDSNSLKEKLLPKKSATLVSDKIEDNIDSMKRSSVQIISREKLSPLVNSDQGVIMKKQRKISTMLREKFCNNKPITYKENDDSSLLTASSAPLCERDSPLRTERKVQQTAQKLNIAENRLLNKLDKSNSLRDKRDDINSVQKKILPLQSDKTLAPYVKTDKETKIEKRRTTPTVLHRKSYTSNTTAHNEHDVPAVNQSPAPLPKRKLLLESKYEDDQVKKKRKHSLMSSPVSSGKATIIARREDIPVLMEGELLPAVTSQNTSLCPQALNRQNKSKVEITTTRLQRQNDENIDDTQKNKGSLSNKQTSLPCERILFPDTYQKKCKKPTNREFISRNYVEESDDDSSISKRSSNFHNRSLFSTISYSSVNKNEDEETLVKKKKAILQHVNQKDVKHNSHPYAFSSENAPVLRVNFKKMLQDRATSTPLRKHQHQAISNITDFEVSSISADEDSMRLHKLWKKEVYKATKKRVKKRDAQ